jgi:hypothetical protein
LRGVYNDLLSDIIKSKTGAAATEPEIARLEKVLPFPGKINPDTFRNIENYVNKISDDQNTLNTTSLEPLEGQPSLGFDFRKSVDRLRAENSTADTAVPVDSMHGNLLELQAARTPQEAQTAVRSILKTAEGSASVDTGRRDIVAAIEMLKQLPVEVRSLPSVDGDEDPVRRLQNILLLGEAKEGGAALNEAEAEARRPHWPPAPIDLGSVPYR